MQQQINIAQNSFKVHMVASAFKQYRPEDDIQNYYDVNGYMFISTLSHGYLVVPRTSEHYSSAMQYKSAYSYPRDNKNTANYVFLEEDCDASDFLVRIGVLKK